MQSPKKLLDIDNKTLVFSTLTLPGVEQMSLDIHLLNQTISNPENILTLRFYHWEGDWLSIGYHQKEIPAYWKTLSSKGVIKIVRRPSGGGAVLHSKGITYALTYKKSSYKKCSYAMVNNWLIKSFKELGLTLNTGQIKKSKIKENCFGTSYTSDLVDQQGFKRIGSAQYRKKGAFLQHGEILIDPSKELWLKLFREKAPPKINFNLTTEEIIKHLTKSFLKDKSNFKIENIDLNKEDITNFLN